jgi:TPP-dependent pyruvate/acetoin dehydrogenase alpha subunit
VGDLGADQQAERFGDAGAEGAAYGMPFVRVDGNDVLAVYSVTKAAVARARAGAGPTSSRQSRTAASATARATTRRSIATTPK